MRLTLVLFLFAASACEGRAETPFTIDTVAGSSWVGDGGPAVGAILRQPEGVATDWAGNWYVSETGAHRVRKIARNGIITTLAGTGVAGFSGDGGTAVAAQLNAPYGLAADTSGNIYIADLGNARVRRVAVDGSISTVVDGRDLAAPRNLVWDFTSGCLYISDFGAHRVLRRAGDGILTVVAGTGVAGFSGDGGAATAARLNFPAGLALDYNGSLYIADSLNQAVRRVSGGVISTAASAGIPTSVAYDFFGTLWIADRGATTVQRITAKSALPVLPLRASDLAMAPDLNLYASDNQAGVVRRRDLAGNTTVVAGGGDSARGDEGEARLALLQHPASVAVDATGALYIADLGNGRLRRVDTEGVITSLAPESGLRAPSAVHLDDGGYLYVSDTGNQRVLRLTPTGEWQTVLAAPAIAAPAGIATDHEGNVYIADTASGKILRIDSNANVTTILDGLAGPRGLAIGTRDGQANLYFSEENGPRVQQLALASFTLTHLAEGQWSTPRGLALNDAGELLVADTGRQQIVKVSPEGSANAIAGSGAAGFSGDTGPAIDAALNFPWDVTVGLDGALYIADLGNDRIRRLRPSEEVVFGAAPIEVLNAASLRPTALAPDMLVSLRGTGIRAAGDAEAFVLINSIAVPIVFADETQIQVQVPREIVTPGEVELVVVRGVSISSLRLRSTVAAPCLFAPASTPLSRGTVMALYGTGLGLGNLPLALTIGGISAEILSVDAGLAYPGLFQINAVIPAEAASGAVDVILMVGDAMSPSSVKLMID